MSKLQVTAPKVGAPGGRTHHAATAAGGSALASLQHAADSSSTTQRLRDLQNGATLQAKAYTVSRQLPLESHYSLKKPKDAQDLLLGKLRVDYPLSPELEEQAKRENWSGDRRDEARGPEFGAKKQKALERISGGGDYYGENQDETMVWTPGAHVAGLSVASERGRKNTPESELTKTVTGTKDWIGAHLIKREWGGEDNMWNVVCWPKAAELQWGAAFEEPIEVAFTNQREKSLEIDVSVEKEDEAISAEEVQAVLGEVKGGKTITDQRWLTEIEGQVLAARSDANRALERIPTKATGSSKLGSAALGKGETNWEGAKASALSKVRTRLANAVAKAPHEKRPVKDIETVRSETSETRTKERKEGWDEETRNYRGERYDHDNNII